MILGEYGFKPGGEVGLRMEAGDVIFRGVEDRVEGFTIGLTLNKLNRQLKIKMLRLQVAQFMLQGFILLFGGEGGIDIDIKAAVIIGQGDTLHCPGQGNLTDKIINHNNAGKSKLSPYDG